MSCLKGSEGAYISYITSMVIFCAAQWIQKLLTQKYLEASQSWSVTYLARQLSYMQVDEQVNDKI